jgi:hypothetical protein
MAHSEPEIAGSNPARMFVSFFVLNMYIPTMQFVTLLAHLRTVSIRVKIKVKNNFKITFLSPPKCPGGVSYPPQEMKYWKVLATKNEDCGFVSLTGYKVVVISYMYFAIGIHNYYLHHVIFIAVFITSIFSCYISLSLCLFTTRIALFTCICVFTTWYVNVIRK